MLILPTSGCNMVPLKWSKSLQFKYLPSHISGQSLFTTLATTVQNSWSMCCTRNKICLLDQHVCIGTNNNVCHQLRTVPTKPPKPHVPKLEARS